MSCKENREIVLVYKTVTVTEVHVNGVSSHELMHALVTGVLQYIDESSCSVG